jgi:hypothetical protein
MTKNITVGLSDEIVTRMEQLKDVNWSAVTRDCIEQYIKQRTAGSLEKAIEKVKAKRSNDFKNGYEFIVSNVDNINVNAIEEIAFPSEEDNEVKLYDMIRSSLAHKILGYTEDEGGDIRSIYYIISNDYIKGMQEAAKELLKRSE